jgi:hypothetical protein
MSAKRTVISEKAKTTQKMRAPIEVRRVRAFVLNILG